MESSAELYPFHQASINERRVMSRLVRGIPLFSIMFVFALAIYAAKRSPLILLGMCAFLNTAVWVVVVSYLLVGFLGVWKSSSRIQEDLTLADKETAAGVRDKNEVVHLIILPTFQEEESRLEDTLVSIVQAEGSGSFRIVLAMEAAEDVEGDKKAERLKDKFQNHFANFTICSHPRDLMQTHSDCSADREVPGKSANLRWSVSQTYDQIYKEGLVNPSCILLTVVDADCIFHPKYFSEISSRFVEMRGTPGGQHLWTIYQAPPLFYRRMYTSSVSSRTWAYIMGLYQVGGLTSVDFSGHHLLFSTYTLPFQLALDAQPWDGDIIIDNHHAHIKYIFYSIYASGIDVMRCGCSSRWSRGAQPALQIEPVYLPLKMASPISDTYCGECWRNQWREAKRHSHSMAECCYAILASLDLLVTFPKSFYSFSLFLYMIKPIVRLVTVQLLPTCQCICLTVLTCYWYFNDMRIPHCPHYISFWGNPGHQEDAILCGLGGAYVLVWPIGIPMLAALAFNVYATYALVVRPAKSAEGTGCQGRSLWHAEDGGVEPTCGSHLMTLVLMIVRDCFMLLPVLYIYGFFAALVSYLDIFLYGNQLQGVISVSSNLVKTKKANYGTTDKVLARALPAKTF